MYSGVVTSLCFHNKSTILVGHGPFLKIYNVINGKLLCSQEVLPNNCIHRIVLEPVINNSENTELRRIIVYGSKYVTLLEIKVNAETASINTLKYFGPFCDWIMDIAWLKSDENMINYDQLAIAYAHNFVQVYNIATLLPSSPLTSIESFNMENQLIYQIQCQIRCILYSARFFGTHLSNLVLASGTVFNQVHLWKINDKNEEGDGIVLREFIGHEGVIFGVRFSPDGSMLASVSDDRTIRIWSLTNPNQPPCINFGHTARVWDCDFVDEYIVSISEDATCRVWKNGLITTTNSGNDDNKSNTNNNDSTMDCLACWEGHTGKNIWSLGISTDHKIVATGGQDSGVRLWSLTSIKENNIDSEDDLLCMRLPEEHRGDMVRNFVLVDNHTIMTSTDQGHLIKFNVSKESSSWNDEYHHNDLRGYSILKQSKCGRIIIAGSISGSLLFYSSRNEFQPFKIDVHNQKIFEIFIFGSQDPAIFYILSNGHKGDTYLHQIKILETKEVIFKTLYSLELPEERITLLSASLVETNGILICGSRESTLLIYQLPDFPNIQNEKIKVYPSIQLQKSHGKQCVSGITIKQNSLINNQDNKNNKNNNNDNDDAMDEDNVNESDDGDDDDHKKKERLSALDHFITFWTTGRDGCYVEYRLKITGLPIYPTSIHETKTGVASHGDTLIQRKDMVLEIVYRNKVTKGWLEGAIYIDNTLLLLGFYKKAFFVYNETKHFEMISVACGGAHRRWHFNTMDAKLNHATFVFIRKEGLYAYIRDGTNTTNGFEDSTLQSNYHGREVRTIKYLDCTNDNQSSSNRPILFATSGEDTILRIHQYSPDQDSKYITHSTIRKHTSVIKSIEWSYGNDILLFTAGGNEEFSCWKLETSPNKDVGPIVVNCLELATCPVVGDERIETRIMDITTVVIDRIAGLHLIGAVYSDAMIRIWLFNEKTRKFSLLVDGTWHAKCILQINHMIIKQNNGKDKILFFTSATDGRVAIWDISEELYTTLNNIDVEMDPTKPAIKLTEPISYYQAHMSGVNNLEVNDYDDDTLLIVSGGEDNAIAAALVSKMNGKLIEGSLIIKPDAHASSVTGVNILSKNNHHNNHHKYRIASVSIDQRLNIWELKMEEHIDNHQHHHSALQLRLVNATFLDVPDPSSLDTIDIDGSTHLAVTGIGIQSVILR
ncbi:unnamed protein product [Cunninghamella blakesleeana]